MAGGQDSTAKCKALNSIPGFTEWMKEQIPPASCLLAPYMYHDNIHMHPHTHSNKLKCNNVFKRKRNFKRIDKVYQEKFCALIMHHVALRFEECD